MALYRMILRLCTGVVLATALLMTATLPLQAQATNEEILKKLEEIEKRLQRLEQRQQEQEAAKPEVEPMQKEEDRKPGGQEMTVDVEQLRRQVDVLAEELEKVRSGEEELVVTPDDAKSLGVGPAAASVYRKKSGVSLAGYGEMLYQNFDSENESGAAVNQSSQLDFLRAIIYAGYRFNDKFIFNSEIEVEHSATDREGSVSMEFAYIDYLASDHFALRGGLLLVPMGLVNEFHEPNVFVGARRPEVESRIIPTTWRENGFGFHGSAGIFDYRAYVVNGLRASDFDSNGLRGGRQKGSEARADNLAFVGRLDVNPTPGVFFGGSLYRGGSGQGEVVVNGQDFDVTTTIAEIHGQAQVRGFDIRGLYATADLDDTLELNQFLGLSGEDTVAEKMRGGYFHVGYNVLNEFGERASLMPYYRFEFLDTQDEVLPGFIKDPSRERIFNTLGLEFKPIYNIVLKADYQWISNEADTGVNQFNVALGYSF
ncbi:MAG TPA: hypothetical protein VLU25_02520 [Acidobacteriota bacterium]|nr:hypothetical protein [Acidobacteriota bacterium]